MRSPIWVSVAVSLLVLCFSGWQIRQNGSTSIREWATVARTSLTITFAVLLLATLGHPAFAGWAKAGTLITREHGHIEGPVPDDHGPGTLPVKVDLANTGSGLARIVGARQTCGVSVTTEFPILLQAGESTPIDFYAKFDDQSALEGTTQISLYVADANQLREQVFAITVPFRGPFSSSNGR